MSASTNTVPAQMGVGRLPSAFAALALVVILAVAVAIVALGSTKAAPAVDSGAKGAPPPAIIDHGWRSAQYYNPVFDDAASPFGGFGGPRAAPVYKGDNTKDDTFVRQPAHDIVPGQRNRPQ